MTIQLFFTADLDQLAHDIYRALCAADCPDLASEAAAMRGHARDAAELGAVLALSDELRVEWQEVRG